MESATENSEQITLEQLLSPDAPDWATIDYFTLLGVTPESTDADIRRAYGKRARLVHPDRAQSEEERALFETRMATLNSAYSCISDPVQRASYAVSLRVGGVGSVNTKFTDIVHVYNAVPTFNLEDPTQMEMAFRRLLRLCSNTPFIKRIDTLRFEKPLIGSTNFVVTTDSARVPVTATLTTVVNGEYIVDRVNSVAQFSISTPHAQTMTEDDEVLRYFPDAATVGFRAGEGPSIADIDMARTLAGQEDSIALAGFGIQGDQMKAPQWMRESQAKSKAKKDRFFLSKLRKKLAQMQLSHDWRTSVHLATKSPMRPEEAPKFDELASRIDEIDFSTLTQEQIGEMNFSDQDNIFSILMQRLQFQESLSQAIQPALIQRFVGLHPGAPTDPKAYKFSDVEIDQDQIEPGQDNGISMITVPIALVPYTYGLTQVRHWMLIDLSSGSVGGYAPVSGAKIAAKIGGGVLGAIVAAPFALVGFGISAAVASSKRKKAMKQARVELERAEAESAAEEN